MVNREDYWDRLRVLLDQIDKKGLKSLNHDELLEFGRLYRRTSSDLSYSQTHGLDQNVRAHLNHLVGRAYGKVYHVDSAKSFSLASIWNFIRVVFPRAIRREWAFVAASTGFFVVTMLIAIWATNHDMAFAKALLPVGMIESIEGVVQRHAVGGDWMPGVTRPLFSAQIMTNNIFVSLLAFSLGITGLGTFYVLGVNGLMLGTVIAAIAEADLPTASNFWGFVAPHGVIEIPAILIAGAAGLILGYALINPGIYDRKSAIRLAAKRAAPIAVGVIMILFVAGLIEGFFSPTLTPDWIKLTFAGILFVGFVIYLFIMPLPPETKDELPASLSSND